jgi:hypothetical protein
MAVPSSALRTNRRSLDADSSPGSKYVDANRGNPNATVAPIPYWENLYPNLAQNGMSATQFIYTHEWRGTAIQLRKTTALADIDFFCLYGCPTDAQGNPISRFWQNQFARYMHGHRLG